MKNLEKISVEYFSRLSKYFTAPFYEFGIREEIISISKENNFEYKLDEWGNLYVSSDFDSTIGPIVLVAHMDHPAFEVVSQDNKIIKLKPLGGHPIQVNQNGVKLRIFTSDKKELSAKIILKNNQNPDKNSLWLNSKYIFAELEQNYLLELPCPAILDLKKFEIDESKRLFRSRVLDDLAGCSAILSAISMSTNKLKRPFIAVFTRAEEVGLIGARLAAESNLINKNANIFSIETSSEIPGVKIGDGPVIRTGDRMSTFDNYPENLLRICAKNLQNNNPKFKFQRALMSAGTCEASAFKSFGYSVSGIAFPLGNWHNRGENSVEEEYLSMDDYFLGIRLMIELICNDFDDDLVLLPNVSKEIKDKLK